MSSNFLVSPDKVSLKAFSDRQTVAFVEAGSYGRGLAFKSLKYLVMHYTAGRGLQSTVAHFQDAANKVSAHLVVGRGGEVVQMVPFNRPAWHAGADSAWKPKGALLADKRINFYSLGIEFENYGPLTYVPGANRQFRTWFGMTVEAQEVGEVDPSMPGCFGIRHWHLYTPTQIEVAGELARVLCDVFKLREILGHSDVAPGVKRDPGPLFPIASIRASVFGRM